MTAIEKGALERALTLCLLEDDEGFVPAPRFVPSPPHWRLQRFYEELLSLRGYEDWKTHYWNPLIEIFGAVYIATAFAMDWTQYERVASSTTLSRIRKEKQPAIRELLSRVKSEMVAPPRGGAPPSEGVEGSSIRILQELESEILEGVARSSALDSLAAVGPPPETAEEGLERMRDRLEQHLATGRFRSSPEWRIEAMRLHKSCSKLLATCQIRLRPGVPLSETDRQRVRDLAEEFYAETFALDAIEGQLKLQAAIEERALESEGKLSGAEHAAALPCREPERVEKAPEEKPAHERRSQEAWLGAAIMLVKNNPEWSDAEIARHPDVSKSASTLSRNEMYRAAAMAARGRKDDVPKGWKDSDTGHVEAIDE